MMKAIFLIVSFLIPFYTVPAQTKPEIETVWNCDAMLGIFDNVASAIASEADENSSVIIVAYSGRNEKSRNITQRRLKALEFYFTEKRGILKERILSIEGRRRNRLAKVEFYIGGKLRDALFFSRNQQVCTGCCPSEYGT